MQFYLRMNCEVSVMSEIITNSKSKSKYHYVSKIVGRHHANSKILINKTTNTLWKEKEPLIHKQLEFLPVETLIEYG